MDRPDAADARWLPINGGFDGKDMWVHVRTGSCGSAALGYWCYAACSVGGIDVVRTLLLSSSAFVCSDVFLVRRYSLVPRPITVENSQSLLNTQTVTAKRSWLSLILHGGTRIKHL